MKLILIFTSLMTILQAFRIAIYYLRNDVSFLKKVIELIILIAMVILSYFNLEDNTIILTIYLATILSFYILVMFIYEKLFKQEYMNTLSVKNGIDMADSGILFLADKNDIVLMNNIMSSILKEPYQISVWEDKPIPEVVTHHTESTFPFTEGKFLTDEAYNGMGFKENWILNKDKTLWLYKNNNTVS